MITRVALIGIGVFTLALGILGICSLTVIEVIEPTISPYQLTYPPYIGPDPQDTLNALNSQTPKPTHIPSPIPTQEDNITLTNTQTPTPTQSITTPTQEVIKW